MTKDKDLIDIGLRMDYYASDKADLLRDTASYIVTRYNLTSKDLVDILTIYHLEKDTHELVIEMFDVIADIEVDNE